jgi:drug/metabolite transporter (DMT)-like permease
MADGTSRQRREMRRVYAAALATLMLWGATPIANKIAIASIDAATAGMLRSAVAGLVCAALAWRWKLPWPGAWPQRVLLAISSVASFAAWPLLLSMGLALTTASHAALLIATIPIFTGLMAAVVERVHPTRSWVLGVAIALAGTFVLIAVRTGGTPNVAGSLVGDLVIFVGVIACAAGYVAGGKLAPAIGTVATTFWGLGIATVVLTPVIAWRWHYTAWSVVGVVPWAAIGYMALFSSLLGYLAWFWALGRGGIARISAWQLGQPVVTVVLAAIVLGERLTVSLAIAGIAVLAGTALTQRRARR